MEIIFRKYCFLGFCALVFLASPVFAVDFEGTSSGIFTNPVGPSGMVTTGVGTNNFTWGDPNGFGTGPSSLTFAGLNPFSGLFETEFKFGTLTYFNGTIAIDTQADSVNLVAMLNFTLPPGLPGDFSLLLNLINTPNTGTPEEQADFVQPGFPFDPNESIEIEGINYFLQFTRFGDIGSNGFITTVNQFHVLEGASARADMFGILTAHPTNAVPEPATMLLLGSGMIGMVPFIRRKLKK